jgi:hypothetical protein
MMAIDGRLEDEGLGPVVLEETGETSWSVGTGWARARVPLCGS